MDNGRQGSDSTQGFRLVPANMYATKCGSVLLVMLPTLQLAVKGQSGCT